jgi:hypothetical protein
MRYTGEMNYDGSCDNCGADIDDDNARRNFAHFALATKASPAASWKPCYDPVLVERSVDGCEKCHIETALTGALDLLSLGATEEAAQVLAEAHGYVLVAPCIKELGEAAHVAQRAVAA